MPAGPARSNGRAGVVSAFDDAAGMGEVAAEGGAVYPFHCVALAGGTRSIDPGTPVTFVVGAGLPGRWEAFAVTPVVVAPAVPARSAQPPG